MRGLFPLINVFDFSESLQAYIGVAAFCLDESKEMFDERGVEDGLYQYFCDYTDLDRELNVDPFLTPPFAISKIYASLLLGSPYLDYPEAEKLHNELIDESRRVNKYCKKISL